MTGYKSDWVFLTDVDMALKGLTEVPADHEFFTKFVRPCSILTKMMDDCSKHPNSEATRHFREVYAKHNGILESFLDFLEAKSKNPLPVAMEKDPLKSNITFKKWYDACDEMCEQLMVIKNFVSIVEPRYYADTQELRIQAVLEQIGSWDKDYEDDSSYWYELRKYVDVFRNENLGTSLKERADKLQAKLSTLLTNDAFYLLIFEGPRENVSTYCNSLVDDKMIESYQEDGCSVVIYRSLEANRNKEKLKSMQDEMAQIRAEIDEVEPKQGLEDIDLPKLELQHTIHNVGFVCEFEEVNAELRFVKSEHGPGVSSICQEGPRQFSYGSIYGCV